MEEVVTFKKLIRLQHPKRFEDIKKEAFFITHSAKIKKIKAKAVGLAFELHMPSEIGNESKSVEPIVKEKDSLLKKYKECIKEERSKYTFFSGERESEAGGWGARREMVPYP